MKTNLYRHFDENGALLYVGISLSAVQRLKQHEKSGWFEDIATVTIESFDTRELALIAESKAIRQERPIHNKLLSTIKRVAKTTDSFESQWYWIMSSTEGDRYAVNIKQDNPFKSFAKFNMNAKVFDYICRNMKQGNKASISQADVAKELDCARQTVALSLKKLEESRHIVKIGKKHHNYTYLVNPNKVWSGDGKLQESCCQKFAKALQ